MSLVRTLLPSSQWCLIHKADVIPLWDNQYTLDILVFHYSEYCFFFFFFLAGRLELLIFLRNDFFATQ